MGDEFTDIGKVCYSMIDFIVVVIVVLVLGAAIAYMIRAKKKGVKCIGCPGGASCGLAEGSACSSGCEGCSCATHTEKE